MILNYLNTEIRTDSSPEEFESVKSELVAKGYSLVFNRYCEGNYFATLSGVDVKHLVYSRDAILRITTDKNTLLPNFEIQNTTPLVEPCMWLFETNHIYIDCGMCIILRLSDGTYFLVDSAHYLSVGDCDRIHDFLKAHTPLDKIIIRGWYFSHAHSDHICQFMSFLNRNFTDTTIEGLYYNFPDYSRHPNKSDWDDDEIDVANEFFDFVPKFNIPTYTLHSGQVFYIGNIKIDVLCTHEDVYPLSMEDFNDTSTAIMLTVEGSKIFIPGDCSRKSSAVLETRWDKNIECDVLQVAHHGHTGLTLNLYEKTKGKIALFANTRIKHDEEYPRRIENRRIISQANEYYVSSEGSVEIPLPYRQGFVRVLPDETTENFVAIEHLWGYTYTDEFKQAVYKKFLDNGGISDRIKFDTVENIRKL